MTEAAERAAVRVHRRPVARLAEGGAARRAGASAMIDVSDGLAADLTHLARASGVGLLLEHVPVATAATVDEAIGGGEDYELVIATADAASLRREFDASGLAPPIALGHCTDRDQGRLWGDRTLDGVGWEHPFGGASGR